jgi:hypothetical protein
MALAVADITGEFCDVDGVFGVFETTAQGHHCGDGRIVVVLLVGVTAPTRAITGVLGVEGRGEECDVAT